MLRPQSNSRLASSRSPHCDVKCAAMQASPGFIIPTSGKIDLSASLTSGFLSALVLVPFFQAFI